MLNLTGNISIHQSVEAQYLMLISHLIEGKSPQIKHEMSNPYNIERSGNVGTTDNVKKIAVVQLSGILTLEPIYNFWGEKIANGTKDIARSIEEATQNPDVIGCIIQTNSGGGYAIASGVVIASIQEFKAAEKTIVGAIEGLCGSLAYEILSYCDAIIALHNSCMVGCIGSQVTIQDASKLYERIGVKTVTIKSSLSPDKNAEIEQALKGNTKPILQNWIDPGAQDFIDTVKSNRPNVSDKILKGSTVLSQDALKQGLIDEIMNFKAITEKIFGGKTFEKSTVTNQTDDDMSLSLVKLGVLASALQISLKNEAKQDLTQDEILDAVQAKVNDLVQQNAKMPTLEARITQLETEKTAETDKLSASQREVQDLQAKIAKSVPSARSDARQEGNDTPPPVGAREEPDKSVILDGEEELKNSFAYSYQ